MASISSTGPLVAECDLVVNGSPLPANALDYIVELTVDQSIAVPSMFTFVISSSDAQQLQTPWVDNQALFSIGGSVEVKMGAHNNLTTLLHGEITSLEPEFSCNRLPRLRVRGYDRRHRLQRGRRTRSFSKQKDSDIATVVGGQAGLSVKAVSSGTDHDYVLQANQTDWEFLCERASRIRYEVFVDDRTLYFQPIANDKSSELTLDLEHDLIEFSPRLSSAALATEVSVQGWSVKDKKEIAGKSTSGDEVSTMGGTTTGASAAGTAFGSAPEVLAYYPVAEQAEADQMAKARFNEIILEFVSGEGICQGNVSLSPGKVIEIVGIGKRFSGRYYVTSAIHRMTPARGYLTEFAVRRNAS